MKINASISEDHGIAQLTDQDLEVLSVGISTGGVAEIRMVLANPTRHIVATTLDTKGVAFAASNIADQHLDTQIEVKLEDVSQPLPYANATFDFIYARLVLHYLTQSQLTNALGELYRVLKPGGKLYVVVRSTTCPDATRPEASYDPATKLTTCTVHDDETGQNYTYSRFFHTEQSISGYLTDAGFSILQSDTYDEQLYRDFNRTELSPQTDNVVEVVAVKS